MTQAEGGNPKEPDEAEIEIQQIGSIGKEAGMADVLQYCECWKMVGCVPIGIVNLMALSLVSTTTYMQGQVRCKVKGDAYDKPDPTVFSKSSSFCRCPLLYK